MSMRWDIDSSRIVEMRPPCKVLGQPEVPGEEMVRSQRKWGLDEVGLDADEAMVVGRSMSFSWMARA